MLFSSTLFLFYFLPVFLLLLILTPKKYKNFTILISSILFYSWGAPLFIFVILFTTFLDFYLVKWMDEDPDPRWRKALLILSLCMNLGLLFWFKYFNFFADNINAIVQSMGGRPIPLLHIILPLGISFYTFETITYVVDVYRKVHKPLHNFWDYQLYIILFPKLIAGPIIRYHELADQIPGRPDTVDDKLTGFYRFCVGLAKKVIIGNFLGAEADHLFGWSYGPLDMQGAWMGALCYTFQIYFDFSGYSDMAIGLGRMMGFRFPENFNHPYTASSVTDFWRRWHITLGSWMKNYLYIPLGGNRVKESWRLYVNLSLVFLASGFWHGAAWTFIFWGAYHGFFLVLERAFLLKIYAKLGRFISALITFPIIVVGWVFFRADSLPHAAEFVKAMFSFRITGIFRWDTEFYFYFFMAAFFSFIPIIKWGKTWSDHFYHQSYSISKHIVYAGLTLFIFLVSASYIIASDFNPFIYFRF